MTVEVSYVPQVHNGRIVWVPATVDLVLIEQTKDTATYAWRVRITGTKFEKGAGLTTAA